MLKSVSEISIRLLPLLVLICAVDVRAQGLVSQDIQSVKGKSQLSSKQIMSQPTNTYDLSAKPTRNTIAEICQDTALFLPDAPQEVTYLISPNISYLIDSKVYKLSGEFKFLSPKKVITLQKYECYVVNTGQKYYAVAKLVNK